MHWYTAVMRKEPIRDAVGPGEDPYSSEIDNAIGRIMPPDRALLAGMIVARTISVKDSE
jgi:hypothetical protein